jgi:uncharacterized protein (TIGR03067 family)
MGVETMASAWWMALILVLVPVLGDDPEVREELDRHQGTWEVVSFVREGEETPREIAATITRVVEDDHVTWYRDGKSFAGTTLVLDPARSPKTLDVIPDGGPQKGKAVLGIYRLEGDELTVCMAAPNAPRPKAFDAAEGTGQTLMTFRRRKP